MKQLRHDHPWFKVLIGFIMLSCVVIFSIVLYRITIAFQDDAPYEWNLSRNQLRHSTQSGQRLVAPVHNLSGATTISGANATGSLKINKEHHKK